MKRFISVILSVLLLLTLLPQTVIAESAYGTAAFTEASGKRGKEVEIRLQLQCEKGLKTIALSDFAFDDSAITLVSGQWLLQGLLSDFNVAKQNAAFAFASNTPVSGDVLKLVFRISDSAAAGDYPISCSITAKEKSTSQELPVDITLTPGKVTVEAPAHIHDFSVLKSDETYHWYQCANGCGEISGKAAHTYGEWTVTKPATETAEGEKTRKCTVCDHEQKESIPAIITANGTAAFSSVSGKPGDTVEITLSLHCEGGLKSMAVNDFQYDREALTLVSGEWQGGAILKDFNAENGTGAFAFAENIPVNGAVLKLSFKISETAATGDYPVICNVVAKQKTDGAENDITLTVTPGKVTVESGAVPAFLPGDVDGDGNVTSVDVRLAMRRAVDLESYEFDSREYRAADIVQDGIISAADARMIQRVAVELEEKGVFFENDGIYYYDGTSSVTCDAWFRLDGRSVNNKYEVTLVLENCVGLRSADYTLEYDPAVLEFKYATAGEDGEKTALTKSNLVYWENNRTPAPGVGSIRGSLYFSQALWTSEEFEANTKPETTVDINGESFKAITFYFNIVGDPGYELHTHITTYPDGFSCGVEEMVENSPYVGLRMLESGGIQVTTETSSGTCIHTGHGEGVVDTPPTCGKDGEKSFFCVICDRTITEKIPASGDHVFGDWTVTKPATETAEGEKERICSVCGFKQTETIPKEQTSYEGPCAYTAVKEIDGNDVIVGVYLSECNEFTSLDLTIRYNNAELFPLINAEGELTVLPGAPMDGMRPDEYRVYGNDFDDGLIRFGMYFNESYTSAETVELALIYFTLADDKVPNSITLSTDVDDVGTFDSTFSVPEQVTTVYDTNTQKLTIIAETETDVMLGDVDMDGKITASDARLALRRAVDLETYPEGSKEFIACDVDKDGKVTANDARSILRAAVDLEDPKTW